MTRRRSQLAALLCVCACGPSPLRNRIGGIEESVVGYGMSDQGITREWQYQSECNRKAARETLTLLLLMDVPKCHDKR